MGKNHLIIFCPRKPQIKYFCYKIFSQKNIIKYRNTKDFYPYEKKLKRQLTVVKIKKWYKVTANITANNNSL